MTILAIAINHYLPSGQSYKDSTIVIYDSTIVIYDSMIVIYDSRVVPDLKIPHITTLDSLITILNCL